MLEQFEQVSKLIKEANLEFVFVVYKFENGILPVPSVWF
jgi:hypothetical protein